MRGKRSDLEEDLIGGFSHFLVRSQEENQCTVRHRLDRDEYDVRPGRLRATVTTESSNAMHRKGIQIEGYLDPKPRDMGGLVDRHATIWKRKPIIALRKTTRAVPRPQKKIKNTVKASVFFWR